MSHDAREYKTLLEFSCLVVLALLLIVVLTQCENTSLTHENEDLQAELDSIEQRAYDQGYEDGRSYGYESGREDGMMDAIDALNEVFE